MSLNLTRLNTAISALEQRATFPDTSAEQTQIDQLAARLTAVGTRFPDALAAVAAPAAEEPVAAAAAVEHEPAVPGTLVA
jgi:hypothetical protein